MLQFDSPDLPIKTLVWMAQQGGPYRAAAENYVNDLHSLVSLSGRRAYLDEEDD